MKCCALDSTRTTDYSQSSNLFWQAGCQHQCRQTVLGWTVQVNQWNKTQECLQREWHQQAWSHESCRIWIDKTTLENYALQQHSGIVHACMYVCMKSAQGVRKLIVGDYTSVQSPKMSKWCLLPWPWSRVWGQSSEVMKFHMTISQAF